MLPTRLRCLDVTSWDILFSTNWGSYLKLRNEFKFNNHLGNHMYHLSVILNKKIGCLSHDFSLDSLP